MVKPPHLLPQKNHKVMVVTKSRYSEEVVQKPAGERLRSLGWKLVYAWNEEKLGQFGTLGRAIFCDAAVDRLLPKLMSGEILG